MSNSWGFCAGDPPWGDEEWSRDSVEIGNERNSETNATRIQLVIWNYHGDISWENAAVTNLGEIFRTPPLKMGIFFQLVQLGLCAKTGRTIWVYIVFTNKKDG